MKTLQALRAAALVLMLGGCAPNGCVPDYSNGSRTGVVTKLSFKGLVYKSWEGELLMGGMVRDSEGHSVPNVFAFNVDPPCVEKVKAAQRSGGPVELVYRQWAIPPWEIEESHVVVDVRTVSGAAARSAPGAAE